MRRRVYFWWRRLTTFAATVGRQDAWYHQPPGRWTVAEAWWVSGVVAAACRDVWYQR